MTGEFYLALSNNTGSRIKDRLKVTITAESHDAPGRPSEDIKLAIRQW